MLDKIILIVIIGCMGCSTTSNSIPCEYQKTVILEVPACGEYQCGILYNSRLKASIDCGQCEDHKGFTCGDNGKINICGNDCQLIKNSVNCEYHYKYSHELSRRCKTLDTNKCVDNVNNPNILCCNFSETVDNEHKYDYDSP